MLFIFGRYSILGDSPINSIEKFSIGRPIWFIYSGMGSQWKTMGKDLLNIEIFRKTFDRCAVAIKPYDIDLYEIVTRNDDQNFKNIVNSALAITATQIAPTDLLFSFGIVPDGYGGHSLGEIGKYMQRCALFKIQVFEIQIPDTIYKIRISIL